MALSWSSVLGLALALFLTTGGCKRKCDTKPNEALLTEVKRRDAFCTILSKILEGPGLATTPTEAFDFLRHQLLYCAKQERRNDVGRMLVDLKLAVSSEDPAGVEETSLALRQSLQLDLASNSSK